MGHTGVIADNAENFLGVLDKYMFERTAVNVFPEQLSDYDKFIDMLEFMSGLRCRTMCRDVDGGESKCTVRQCVVDNGYVSCHECDGFEECDKLSSHLGRLHIEAAKANLKGISKIGLDQWLEKGKKHSYWDKE